ncbi:MAG: hypothetical protein FWG31_08015 [Oscillospiraceae bacterium]|nr:hypothetical protein [Oscillospiraceae bacterium]
MEYVRQTIGSSVLNGIIEIPPALRDKRVEIIVLPVQSEVTETPNHKCNIGFAKGAEIPDSFFEPLSEEDLQAWGL